MIEINLLGQSVSPPKPPREPIQLPIRKILTYVLILVVGYAGIEYLPPYIMPLFEQQEEEPDTPSIDDLLAEAEKLKEALEEPEPAAPETTAPAPAKPEPEPEPVAPEPTPPPAPVGDMALLLRQSAQHVRTYAALHSAVLPGSQYELLSVGDDHFITELWSDQRVLVEKYQQSLRRNLPKGRTKISPIQQNLETSAFHAQVWGSTTAGTREAPVPSQYDDAKTLVRKIGALAGRHHIKLLTATPQTAQNASGFQRIPLHIKLRGNDARSLTFLRNLDAQGWNIAIQKISSQPTEGYVQMQMHLTLDVLVPTG
jgi:hypothetical protein